MKNRPPASGKGTQCKLIANKFNMLHISAGDSLREELAKTNSCYKDLIIQYMKGGKIVPVKITCSLLKNKIFEAENVNKIIKFIFIFNIIDPLL